MNPPLHLAKVVVRDGSVTLRGLEAYEGKTLIARLDPPKISAQLGRYFDLLLPIATRRANRHLQPGELPKHETEVHQALKRAFLGVKPVELEPLSLSLSTKQEMSDFLTRIEAYLSGVGEILEKESDHS